MQGVGRSNKRAATHKAAQFTLGGYARGMGHGGRVYRVVGMVPGKLQVRFMGWVAATPAQGTCFGPAKVQRQRWVQHPGWGPGTTGWLVPITLTPLAPAYLRGEA